VKNYEKLKTGSAQNRQFPEASCRWVKIAFEDFEGIFEKKKKKEEGIKGREGENPTTIKKAYKRRRLAEAQGKSAI